MVRRVVTGVAVGLAGVLAAFFLARAVVVSYSERDPHATPHAAVELTQRPSQSTVFHKAVPATQASQPPVADKTPPAPPPKDDDNTRAAKIPIAVAIPRDAEQELVAKFPVIALSSVATDYAFDAETGQIAVALGNSLGIYRAAELTLGKTAEPRLIDVGGPATAVAIKPLDDRRLFVVGVDSPPRFVVIDAVTLEIASQAPLMTKCAVQLAASRDAADPHVIYSAVEDYSGPRIFDLRRRAQVGQLGRGVVDYVFSADGRTLLFRSMGREPVQGLFAARWNGAAPEGPGSLETVAYQPGEPLAMYVHPRGMCVASGLGLLSPDLRSKLTTAPFEPQAFFRERPWMAGVCNHHLFLGSINDGRAIAQVVLPRAWLAVPKERQRMGYRPRRLSPNDALPLAKVFADEKNAQFLLGTPSHLAAFPLLSFNAPEEIVLWRKGDLPLTATIGRPLEARLEFWGEPSGITLGKHPAGMELDGRAIKWTPAANQYGEHEIGIVAHSQDISRQETWRVRVERAAIQLPFVASGGISLGPDGRRALVWGEQIIEQGSAPAFQRLAMVDLEREVVVAETRAERPLLHAVMGEDAAYALWRGEVARLSPDKLEVEARAAVGGQPLRLALAGSRGLTVLRTNAFPSRFGLPNLDPLPAFDHDIHTSENWLDGPCGEGWLWDGVLWNKTMERPLLLIWPYQFHCTPWQDSLRGLMMPRVGAWHPFPSPAAPPQLAPGEKQVKAVSHPHSPAVLAIVQGSGGYRLSAHAWKTGLPLAAVPLTQTATAKARFPDECLAIGAALGKFAVLIEDRLLVGAAAELGPLPPPLHIVPRQDGFLLPLDAPFVVRYEAASARNFRLESRLLGGKSGLADKPLTMESSTGEFTLSVGEALEPIIESYAGLAANLPQGRELDNEQRTELFLASSTPTFGRLVGREPQGIPLAVGVHVTAEGEDFHSAGLRHDFLIEVPRDRFEAALDRLYPHSRNPWKPAPAWRRPEGKTAQSESSPPQGTGPWHDYLRSVWSLPRPVETGAALRDKARAAKAAGDERLRQRFLKWLAGNDWRLWTDAKGKEVEALLVQEFGGQVVLRTRAGAELTLAEDQLSAADREYLAKRSLPATPADTSHWRQFLFRDSLRAALDFHRTYSFLPPRVLVADAGNVRLSWRVLLLPQLGYEELYSLFHFDQPWDSPHNRELIAFMPHSFAVDLATAREHKTTLVAVEGPASALRTDRAVSVRDIPDGANNTVLLVEAAVDGAVAWTQPFDIPLAELARPADALAVREGHILAGMLDSSVATVPSITSRDDWRFAIEIGDRRKVEAFAQPAANGKPSR